MFTRCLYRRVWLPAATLAMAVLVSTAPAEQPSPEAARLDVYKAADGASYFALSLQPGSVPVAAAHDVVVLFDTSASQVGPFRDAALGALKGLVRSLGPQDRVRIIAVDVNAVPMSESLVAPNSPEMAAALAKLEARVPLGATDMPRALTAATEALSGSSNPRAVVYIGKGTSKANPLSLDQFKKNVGSLVAERIPVTSYAIGPDLDVALLGALANQTGGRLLFNVETPDPAAVGAALASTAGAPVLWPDQAKVSFPKDWEIYPAKMPPLRTDRDTVLIGKYAGDQAGPVKVEMAVQTAAGSRMLSWTVAPGPASDDNNYLVQLVDTARADGGMTLPLVGSDGLAMARQQINAGAEDFSKLAVHALNTGNPQQAMRLASQALHQDPGNPDAATVMRVAQKQVNAEAPAGPSDLDLTAPPAAPPVEAGSLAAPPGALAAEVEQTRTLVAQQVTAEVQAAIGRARAGMSTNPEAAIQDLKLQIETVRRVPDLDPDLRDQLVAQLAVAVRQAEQQKVIVDQRRQQQQEILSSVRERQIITEDLLRRQQKLTQLMERYNSLMDEGRYRLAEDEAAAEATREDPGNPTAISAVLFARSVANLQNNLALRVARQKAVLDTLYSVEKSFVPFPDDVPIVYPDAEIWQRLTAKRRERWGAVDLAGRGEAEKKIAHALQSPTELDFTEAPLSDVIQFLKDYHGIEIQLDKKALDQVGITSDTPVTQNLKGITLRSALRLVLHSMDLTYVIRNEVLLITTPDEANLQLATRVYPVADLVVPVQTMGGGMGGGMMGGMGGGMGGGGMGGGGGMDMGMGGGMGGGGMGGGMGGGGMGGGGGGFFNLPPNFLQQDRLNGFHAFSVQDDLTLTPAASAPAPASVSETRPAAASQPAAAAAPAEAIPLEVAQGKNPEAAWDAYFASHRPASKAVRDAARSLMNDQKFADQIALINAALRHGQAQPWMYEALGIAMQAEGRPSEEIERAVMSAIDFSASPLDLMVVGLYMERIGLDRRALSIYQTVGRLTPTSPEPYMYGLRVAQKLNDLEGIQWATLGIVGQAWTADKQDVWNSGMRTAKATLEQLRKEKRTKEADAYEAALKEAMVRDCVVKVSWTGEADVDLMVEEPTGTICSFRTPRTTGGGVMLGDTFSEKGREDAEGFSEVYVLPKGFNGQYRLLLRRVWGNLTAGKAKVTVCQHYGSDKEKTISQTIDLAKDEAMVQFDLAGGRRTEPLEQQQIANAAADQLAIQRQIVAQRPDILAQALNKALNPAALAALAQVGGGSSGSSGGSGGGGSGGINNGGFPLIQGAVGYQPVIQVLPAGAMLATSAVVSADRRYVRYSGMPFFSAIGQVFTFNFASGTSGTSQGGNSGGFGGGGFGGGAGGGGGGKGIACFVAGTLVACPDHQWRKIESIRPGDTVLAWNLANGRIVPTQVKQLDVHPGRFDLLALELSTHETIQATLDHPFLNGRTWTNTEGLARNRNAMAASGKLVNVLTSTPTYRAPTTVYNIQTEMGTYLVGRAGLIVSGRHAQADR